MKPEGQDPLYATLLAAALSQLMLGVAKDLFPQRSYFELASAERETIAEHVRHLIHEAQTTFAGLQDPSSHRKMPFPPQREEEYL